MYIAFSIYYRKGCGKVWLNSIKHNYLPIKIVWVQSLTKHYLNYHPLHSCYPLGSSSVLTGSWILLCTCNRLTSEVDPCDQVVAGILSEMKIKLDKYMY